MAGPKKKNALQKHKSAEAERKRKQEEEEARVLAEFEASFGVENKEQGAPERRGIGEMAPSAAARPPVGNMSRPVPGPTLPSVSPVATQRRGWEPERSAPAAMDPASMQPPDRSGKEGGRKQIDLVMEKLRGPPEGANGMEPGKGMQGEKNPRGPQTLMETFARYGPLASVKIMWPRKEDDDGTKTHNSGFVGFMTRASAEAALTNLNNSLLHGSELRIGYGKSIAIPPQPIYPPPQHVQQIREHVASVASNLIRDVRGEHHWGRGQDGESLMHTGVGPDIVIMVPKEERIRFIIDTLARFILEDGTNLEQLILENEHRNPEYAFLRDVDSPEHMYYRWRLYSLCNADSMSKWRADPFVMIEGAPRIVPPPQHGGGFGGVTAAQRGYLGQERDREQQLSELERERLEDMLRSLRVERSDIRTAMLFVLDHASCAVEISEVLIASLTLEETPPHLKVSRSEEVISREGFRRCTLRVLRVWKDWYLFSEEFLAGLQALFLLDRTPEWRKACPDQVQEWTGMDPEALERQCRTVGVLYYADDLEATIDHLVGQRIFTLYGTSGVPAAVLDGTGGSGNEAGDSNENSKGGVGLITGYGSGSDAEDSPVPELAEGQTLFSSVPVLRPDPVADAEAHAKAAEAAKQWEEIEEDEPEATDTKPMSQYLFEKQADAARAAAAAAAERAAAAAAAQERLQQLEEEEAQLQALRERQEADALAGKASPAAEARGEWCERAEQENVQALAGLEAGEVAPERGAGPSAGSDEYRRQMREIELRVVELQEELEEQGVSSSKIEQRSNTLRVQLRAQVKAGADLASSRKDAQPQPSSGRAFRNADHSTRNARDGGGSSKDGGRSIGNVERDRLLKRDGCSSQYERGSSAGGASRRGGESGEREEESSRHRDRGGSGREHNQEREGGSDRKRDRSRRGDRERDSGAAESGCRERGSGRDEHREPERDMGGRDKGRGRDEREEWRRGTRDREGGTRYERGGDDSASPEASSRRNRDGRSSGRYSRGDNDERSRDRKRSRR